MSRTPQTFGGNLGLICALAVLLPYQASNFAKKRIMTLAADGADGARVAKPRWVRVIDRIVTAVVILYGLVLIATTVLAFKGWYTP